MITICRIAAVSVLLLVGAAQVQAAGSSLQTSQGSSFTSGRQDGDTSSQSTDKGRKQIDCEGYTY